MAATGPSSAHPSKHRIQVPDSLRDLLLEFSISYLLEQPGDVVDYAVEFFTRLQEKRNSEAKSQDLPSPDESVMSTDDEPVVHHFANRRKSVFAEAYDPEADDSDDVDPANSIFPKSDEQRTRLMEAVKNILLFRALEPEQMNQVLDAMFERKVVADETVIMQGDDGDNFYVIESGLYDAYVNDNHIFTYENCGSFGELALLYNMPRAATVKAKTIGQLWAMDRNTFRRILLKGAFRKRKMYETLLDSVPMLKALQNYERMNLADALVPKSFEKGEQIIKQGDAADGMYFIEEGSVSIRLEQDEEEAEVEISVLNKGGYFGELALVTHRPRAASAYATTNIKVAFLDVEAFERLLGPCMNIMKRNIGDYDAQMERLFGSKSHAQETR